MARLATALLHCSLIGVVACATAATTTDGQPGVQPADAARVGVVADAAPNGVPPADAAPGGPQFMLSISKSGNGVGTVTANVGGIDCGSTCDVPYAHGTVVILTATAGPGDTFGGWTGGGCSGTGTCMTTISAATAISASFTCSASAATFVYTGSVQTYAIGSCITHVHIEAWGAQGASGQTNGTQGGLGGYAKGDLAASGAVLTVMVGGQSAFNGGGFGVSLNTFAANGGDASDVRLGGSALANRILVAGGGGGGGVGDAPGLWVGGAGGGGTCGANYCGGAGGKGFGNIALDGTITDATGASGGTNGGAGITTMHATGGGGGGLNSGGGASCETYDAPSRCATDGSLGFGGAGDSGGEGLHGNTCYTGVDSGAAGGGGGYYGGGGTSLGWCGGGGGGGGSSWTGTLTSPIFTAGTQSGTGKVIITPF